ncbi:MAG TPA: hypothetical protein VJ765_01535 [Chitinophagaceae bacterium]|nr:hypothetical protein [Chitinophagaceae bacterium]
MKKIIILSVYFFSIAGLFMACEKDVDGKLPELTRFPVPLVVKVDGTDQVISAQNPDAFSGKFSVGLYFPNDGPPKKFDVVVMKNNDNTNVKMIKADVTTFPTEIPITGTELAALFGSPIVLGDKFDIGVDVVTYTGAKFEAFPVTGNSYAAGIAAQPGASTFVRYEAVCQYDATIYQGSFEVIIDEWGDYAAGEIVPVTMVDATHFSFKYRADDASPIVVTVNTVTNAVTVPKQVYGTGYPPGWPYGNISAESVPSVDNFVAPCAGTFSVILKHTVAAGSFGEYKIVLKKN